MDQIKISDNTFDTLVAITEIEQQRGLMHQDWPPPVMSFIYSKPSINKFWMKNTPSPLDIIFCRDNKIVNICYGEPFSTRLIGNDEFTDLVIELPAGTCEKFSFKVGDDVKIFLSRKSIIKIYSTHKKYPINSSQLRLLCVRLILSL